jgi:hypothetical protein
VETHSKPTEGDWSDAAPRTHSLRLLRGVQRGRCGVDGFKRLKAHAFFRTMDWRKLLRRQITPPFVPEVKDETNQLTTLEDLLDRDEDENTPLDPQVEALLDQHF